MKKLNFPLISIVIFNISALAFYINNVVKLVG